MLPSMHKLLNSPQLLQPGQESAEEWTETYGHPATKIFENDQRHFCGHKNFFIQIRRPTRLLDHFPDINKHGQITVAYDEKK